MIEIKKYQCEYCDKIFENLYEAKQCENWHSNDGFETKSKHLNLNNALEEIKVLYHHYGLELDKNLTKDAIVLKNQILFFVNEIKKL